MRKATGYLPAGGPAGGDFTTEVNWDTDYPDLATDQALVALLVGQASGAPGELTITGGGTVDAVSMWGGAAACAYGHLILDNAQLTLNNTSTLIGPTSIGHHGDGDLTLRNGASMEYYRLYMSRGSAVTSNIVVEGANSLLKGTNTITVGYRGWSTLHVRNGGELDASAVVISERTRPATMIVENATAATTSINLGRPKAAGTLQVLAGGP